MSPVTHGVPVQRLRRANAGAVRADGRYVLYWMVSARRLADNHALQYAAGEAVRLGRPLMILEAMRCDHEWASARFHRFVMHGMAERSRRMETGPVLYHPWIETRPGEGRGLLGTLAADACLVVTDEYPAFFIPGMVAAAARRIGVRMVAVDSNGLLPMRVADREFTAAYHFRRFLQRELPAHLETPPHQDPLAGVRLEPCCALPAAVTGRWPATTIAQLEDPRFLASVPIDQQVAPVAYEGGESSANRVLRRFLDERLAGYDRLRNEPDAEGTSGLSPWLHWGHIAVHTVFRELARGEGWDVSDLSKRADGKKSGWWGMSPAAESFLDEIVTWRELGFINAARRPDHASWDSLPDWARATLTDHEADPRPWSYSLAQLEAGETHDPLWNAAQHQLRRDGRIHNYLRMLWGKKILEWTRSSREAAEVMIHLNDRWAIDGRDPNSYSGIFWCLGRYDRPWPERPIYGKVRSMTSDSTRRKYRVDGYIARWTRGGDRWPA
jgi:deoxyribodipyrimidine photo-lyase